MSKDRNLFNEFARVADGAAQAFSGIRSEMDSFARQQMERLLADMDLVSRDEFEAVKAMAAKARTEQEALEKRLTQLETRLGVTPARKPSRPRKAKPPAP